MTPTDPELVTRLRADRYDSIEELFALKCAAADALEAAEARVQQLEAALTATEQLLRLAVMGDREAANRALAEAILEQAAGRADTQEPRR